MKANVQQHSGILERALTNHHTVICILRLRSQNHGQIDSTVFLGRSREVPVTVICIARTAAGHTAVVIVFR